MEITKQQHNAAKELVELIAAELGENRAIHPATAISSCALLSGSFMFRSFNLQLKDVSPGNVVLSEEANEKWPVLMNIVRWMLDIHGIGIDDEKLNEMSAEKSNLKFLDTLNLLQSKAAAIMSENNLDFEQMAYSGAIATSFLIKECQHDLAVEIGFNTAVFGFIEGCKTYPPAFQNTAPKKKSFFKFWK